MTFVFMGMQGRICVDFNTMRISLVVWLCFICLMPAQRKSAKLTDLAVSTAQFFGFLGGINS